jgi:hypothetical protein
VPLLATLIARAARRAMSGAHAIGAAAGKVIGEHKMAKYFQATITGDGLTVTRRQDSIDAETAMDGIYVIRTPVPGTEFAAAGVVPPARTSGMSSGPSTSSNPGPSAPVVSRTLYCLAI